MGVFPLFVGSGRSGTTMFGLMFDSHPDLVVTHEAHFVAGLAVEYPSLLRREGFDRRIFMEGLEANANFRRLDLPLSEVAEKLSGSQPDNYADAVRAVFELFAQREGKTLYGDKTPGYVNHLDLLAGLFPEAKFVHIIRDGRDVALAYVERPEWGPRTIPEAAMYWSSRVERGRDSGRRLGPDRYQEVRYESLIADAEGTVKDLCRFLGLEFHPAMLDYHQRGETLAASTKDPQAFTALSKPPTRGLRDWRTQMKKSDIALFEAIAGDLLVDLGYERSTSATSGATRLRVGAARTQWQIRRIGALIGRTTRRFRRARTT
jgi:hypothetical protein